MEKQETKEELTKRFQKALDREDDQGKQAIRMIYEILVDIRDGLIK